MHLLLLLLHDLRAAAMVLQGGTSRMKWRSMIFRALEIEIQN